MEASVTEKPDEAMTSWALATDLYQLTMAQGYLASRMADRASIFHMFYRTPPFGGRYVVTAGIEPFSAWLEAFRFGESDLAFLASLSGAGGRPLFSETFLAYLGRWRFRGTIDAVPEGTIVFPHEPMVRVRAPLLDAQLLETPLLAMVNHQSLIATKASRVRLAAGDDEVLEFGLRRAPGLDGGLAASRAAYIGGVDATSNVLAAQRFAIPARGTHAHSWILAFGDELQAFSAYAELFPHNSVLLVDTYETLNGVRNAIAVGGLLRRQGADLLGIRLDSGDLASLAVAARTMLDDAGFSSTKIVASGDLDEHLLLDLKKRGAPIDIWGVGTKMVTAHDDPALGGVYKLAAVADAGGELVERMKICDQPAKTSIPGCLDTVRFKRDGLCVGDCIFDTLSERRPGEEGSAVTIRAVTDPRQSTSLSLNGMKRWLLLQPLFVDGRRVADHEPLAEARQRALEGLAGFDRSILRFVEPHDYPAGLSEKLYQRREAMRAEELGVIRRGMKNDRTSRRYR